MVYFVSHVFLKHGNWLPLSSVPVSLVNLKEDGSPRNLSRYAHSIQLVWQPGRLVKPLCCSIIKTHFIREFQRAFRKFITRQRAWKLPSMLSLREIGINNPLSITKRTFIRRYVKAYICKSSQAPEQTLNSLHIRRNAQSNLDTLGEPIFSRVLSS